MAELKLALLGKELSHSRSPELHNALFEMLRPGFPQFERLRYDLVECPEECDLAQWIKTASANGYAGANITYPYKAKAFELSDNKIGVASAIDSANCVRFSGDRVSCSSTDGRGLLFSILRKYPHFDLGMYHVVLVGAGEAARAVIYTLCTTWMPFSLTITNRSIGPAEELAEFCIAQSPGPTVRVMTIDNLLDAPPEQKYRLVIQCTPVGQINHPGNVLSGFQWHETDFAIDLIYNPSKTEFLTEASRGGAKTLNGTGMLIEQAALSHLFWLNASTADVSPLTQNEFDNLLTMLMHQ